MSVLELQQVTKKYGDLEVLHGVDLAIDSGELVAVLGPSGSGKSTLLHIMGTLDRPTTGTVIVDGHDTAALSEAEVAGLRAHRIGFVFQAFHLLDGLSAVDNVGNGLLYTGTPRAERRARAHAMLTRVGLGDRADQLPRLMSGGERQRVAIARALLNRPAIVFADEPTGNLDSHNGAEVLSLLKELNADGTTIVVITHEHEVAAAMHRQIEVRDGQIVRVVEQSRVVEQRGTTAASRPRPRGRDAGAVVETTSEMTR
jgi:putative ABC transport system ATP-binding protein